MTVQLGMAIDTQRCIACDSCVVACKVENNLPNGIWYNSVFAFNGGKKGIPIGSFPNLELSNATLACQHCEMPACLVVCPVQAITKREDGLVAQDNEKCIGCKLCLTACPYTGVRTYIEEEPAYHIDFAVGDMDAPTHTVNTVEKCTFCIHRIDRGEEPACCNVCPGRARIFGDLNDPESEISKKLVSREHSQLLPEEGTNPSVYFLK